MALNSLVIPPGLTPGQIMQATPPSPGASFSQTLLPILPPGMEDGGGPQLFPNRTPPMNTNIDQLPPQFTKAMPLPDLSLGGGIHSILPPSGSVMPIDEIRRPRIPMPGPYRPGPILGQPLLPKVPDYSSQFEKFGEQLTGFGDQMTGYQDALGSFNEQVGGMGKQFETISNRLDSVDKGLGSLGNQIASLENMQKAQPQQVMQPQRPTFNPFGFGGFGGFGGLGSLFGRRY